MKKRCFIPLFVLFFHSPTWALFKVEILNSGSTYNYFSIPSSSENRVDLPDTKKLGAFRIFYEKGYKDWSWTLLYAPLALDYSFTADKNFTFNKTAFDTGKKTNVFYQFNSYRLGYRKIKRFGMSRFFYGGVLKIRDAEICVTQSGRSSC